MYGERNCGSGVSRGWNMLSWLPWLFFQKVDLGCQLLKQDQKQLIFWLHAQFFFVDNPGLWLLFSCHLHCYNPFANYSLFFSQVGGESIGFRGDHPVYLGIKCHQFFKISQKSKPERSDSISKSNQQRNIPFWGADKETLKKVDTPQNEDQSLKIWYVTLFLYYTYLFSIFCCIHFLIWAYQISSGL